VFVEDLVKGVSVWEASVNDVDELPSQVSFSFHVSIPFTKLSTVKNELSS